MGTGDLNYSSRHKQNAGGMNVTVGGGTCKPASAHPAQYKRRGSGVNNGGKGPSAAQPRTQNTHSPKGGGHSGKTAMKIARQNKGSRRPYPM